MTEAHQKEPGLEIDQDLGFQEHEWRLQRVIWMLLLAIVVLALFGLFGTGPLSSMTAGSEDEGITLDYERFVRHDGRASLVVDVSPDQVSEGQVELWLDEAYLGDIQIETISPQPNEVRSDGDRQVYVFLAEDPTAPITITFSYRPDTIGRLSGDMGIVDGPTLSFDQLSYP